MERLIFVTGLSGSGKSLAAQCFEDLGYFCVDNLPVAMIPPFCELIQRSGDRMPHTALVVDAREGKFLHEFPETLERLRENELPVELLFFDCSDEVLKRRFSETRRPHPMSGTTSTLDDALAEERSMLAPLRELADRIIDTTRYTSHELKAFLNNAYATGDAQSGPNVNLLSFGFKHGPPAEADLLFDVRFLPNPYFVDGLRHLDGRSEEVQRFLDDIELTGEFFKRLTSFLDFLLPHYAAEGKSYLTVAIGCTGGKHRSVALVEKLAAHLSVRDVAFTTRHRDLGKE
ncbi:MAG: RNase adapter RapZ [Acidobacteriota bacterium]